MKTALSKFPDDEFSPVRLQAVVSLDQPSSACWPVGAKPQACMPHLAASLIEPSSRFGPPATVRVVFSGPSASDFSHNHHGHRSLAPNGLCCPIPLRYSDPLRQSRQHLELSQDH